MYLQVYVVPRSVGRSVGLSVCFINESTGHISIKFSTVGYTKRYLCVKFKSHF